MAVEAGTRVGHLVIHEYLGQGDLGLVFGACGPTPGSVAVKVLRGLAPEAGDRFRALAERLVALEHPHVAAVLQSGEHEGMPYLVEEYIGGGSLADRIRHHRVDPKDAIRMLRGIAAAVDHAHALGLVHGALKPQQVVLDPDGQPVVTDFGLAALRWPPPDGVTVAVTERDAAYAAPELVAGGHPTAAADRYAFATIAYELLAGRRPFEGEPHDVMNAQLNAPPPAPSAVDERVDGRVDGVV